MFVVCRTNDPSVYIGKTPGSVVKLSQLRVASWYRLLSQTAACEIRTLLGMDLLDELITEFSIQYLIS